MGQESTGIDNLEKDLKVEENTEVKKIMKKWWKRQKEQKKKIKKDISRENKMQIREFLDFLEYEKGSSQSTVDGYNRDLVQFFYLLKKIIMKLKNTMFSTILNI